MKLASFQILNCFGFRDSIPKSKQFAKKQEVLKETEFQTYFKRVRFELAEKEKQQSQYFYGGYRCADNP